ncbi:MAG TPA: hypothetical protein V6D11_03465 [Waterburya sp.]|jgi:hypothetical protein
MIQPTFVQIPLELIRYVRSCKLSGNQYDLWLYFWELDPFGDRWVDIPPPAEIARILNVNERTIRRSAQRLQDLELFDFQIEKWKCRNTTASVKLKSSPTDKNVRVQTKRSKRGQNDPNVSNGIEMSENGQNDPNVTPEASFNKDSDSLQTYTDFLQTLSDTEREKFLEFGLKKAAELPKPPTLPRKWIERNWQELSAEFSVASQTPSQIDSAVLEQEQQEQISAARKELVELQKRQQKWKEEGQGTRR